MLRDFFSYYIPYKKLFLLDFLCAVLAAFLELLFPVAVNSVIDQVLPTGNLKVILMFSVLLLALYAFNATMNYIVVAIGHTFGSYIERDMRLELYEHYQKLSYKYFDEAQTGHIMSRITSDLFEISELAHHGPEDIFVLLMTVIGSFILMLRVHFTLALITVSILPILFIALYYFSRLFMSVNVQIKTNIAQLSSGIQNAVSGMKVVKAFANEDYEYNQFNYLAEQYRQAMVRFYKSMARSSTFNYFILRLVTLIAFITGSYFTLKGELTVGELVGYILLTNNFVRPMERINAMLEIYPKGLAGFKRFKDILAIEPDISDKPDAIEAPSLEGDIQYNDVSFAYTSDSNVLSNINISIKAGETIAFVGPSGSGKTTLVNLLPRFYEVTEGSITIDGYDIRDLTMNSLRKQIGVVQQDVFIFDGTIKENVLYGRLDATDEEVREAIRLAKLDEVIQDLPEGIDTRVGERGARLSGGQKQRLSIARIFLKNPPILILDEATSALDTATERFIQDSLDQLAQGRTSLIIAHRLATIVNADRIIVLTPAGIIEEGSHDELMSLNGHYAALYNAQFQYGAGEINERA